MNKVAIPVGVTAFLGLGASYYAAPTKFAAIDRCLQSGRAWEYRTNRCQALPAGPVDRIIVDKSDRRLQAFRGDTLVREFRVALGRGGLAPKQRRLVRVPEGAYLITESNAEPLPPTLRIATANEQLAAAQAPGSIRATIS